MYFIYFRADLVNWLSESQEYIMIKNLFEPGLVRYYYKNSWCFM